MAYTTIIKILESGLSKDELIHLLNDENRDANTIILDPEDENYEVITAPEDIKKVKTALEGKNIKLTLAEVTMLPKSYVKLEAKDAERMLKLMEALEDHDDVQNVYANFDIPDQIMAKTE